VDLKKLVAEGRFRSDLYYRLNVLPIHVPALRERRADIGALAEHILESIAERTGLPKREIAPSAVEALARYDWPGNVRELRNVLEQVTLLSDNSRLGADDIVAILPAGPRQSRADALRVQRYEDALRDFEAGLLRTALEAHGGKVEAAAKALGLSRATLYKKLARIDVLSTNRDIRLVS
jgi:DNA-binding NtrC family response regulator